MDAAAAAKVTTALRRLELGNFSNVKGVGGGVFEYRIDFGPGYRVYFGKDGDTVDARSILGLMMLNARQGSFIQVSAEGEDAREAIAAILALIHARFGED